MLDEDNTPTNETAAEATAPETATQAAPTAAEDVAAAETTAPEPPAKKAAPRKKAAAKKAAPRKSAAKKAAASAQAPEQAPASTPEQDPAADSAATEAATTADAADSSAAAPKPKKKAASKPKKKAAAKTAPAPTAESAEPVSATASDDAQALFEVDDKTAEAGESAPAAAPKQPAKRTRKKATAKKAQSTDTPEKADTPGQADEPATEATGDRTEAGQTEAGSGEAGSGEADMTAGSQSRRRRREPAPDAASQPSNDTADPTDTASSPTEAATEDGAAGADDTAAVETAAAEAGVALSADDADETDDSDEPKQDDANSSGEGTGRRRRRRGGRRRRGRAGNSGSDDNSDNDAQDDSDDGDDSGEQGDGSDNNDGDNEGGGSSRRRRQRQRRPRNPEDEIASVSGSTRLEAKKQRRREGREAGRRRAPIVSEAEFLARRESVERVMVIRQRDDLTQIGVLEDKVLVEHYVSRQSQTSLIGNVYLGRVQNVLPSMEAAFVDIGKGRNAVLYAGEVNWSALGHKDGEPRKIESVLTPGQTILVQVTKDPVGHKGARLSGQVSIPGRFLVYVPDGNTSGISRKLPDTERSRLKALLKEIVPDSAGVIVRTAAEGASEEELTLDVERLTARWADIEAKVKTGKGPELLYGEPDLTLKVVRDLFTEDFSRLIVQGDDAWDLVQGYVSHVAPDLEERLERFEVGDDGRDVFAAHRVDEQIAKGLDRKVWLPSGGSLIIDRTEAMTVVDVNTGKFTGSGGNLEETVTKNNLEAAEEMVRQLRLRDIGGIIVIDFIDMVLESNRELVLRRLVECLGRDRTRHQVAEVTSLGLVQMTRKRIGTGLVEAFSEDCSHCKGRGIVVHDHPTENDQPAEDDSRRGRGRGGRGRGRGGDGNNGNQNQGQQRQNQTPAQPPKPPSPADLAGTRPKPVEDAEGTPSASAPGDQGATNDQLAAAAPASESPQASQASGGAPAAKTDASEQSQAAQGESAQQQQPKAPTVTTTTRRRRTATRPAGPPAASAADAVSTGAEATSDDSPPDAAPSSAGATSEALSSESGTPAASPSGAAQGQESAQQPAAAEPEAPQTPTAPAADSADDADPVDGDATLSAQDEVTEDAPVLHVPVKRKGTRKR